MSEQDKIIKLRVIVSIVSRLESIERDFRNSSKPDDCYIAKQCSRMVELGSKLKNIGDLGLNPDDPKDRQKLIELALERDNIGDGLNLMRIDDSFYLGWAHGIFTKIGEDIYSVSSDSKALGERHFDREEAISYLELEIGF